MPAHLILDSLYIFHDIPTTIFVTWPCTGASAKRVATAPVT